MGAQITLGSSSSVLIEGPSQLRGTRVRALDIRAGAAAVVAALAADGTTTIEDIHHLDRGYENLAGTLSSIGAKIERV
jgi:UDP-N-acetylglucosamine 1-carboxyvinyltransferase